MKLPTLAKLLFVSTVFAIAGCSSGGGGGGDSDSGGAINSNRLAIDDATKIDAADGSRRGARKAINTSNAPVGAVVDEIIPLLAEAARSAVALGNAPVGAIIDVSAQVCTAGGSATANVPDNPPSTGTVTSTFSYDDCMYSVGGVTYTINGGGTITIDQDNPGNFDFEYDLTITDGSQTYTVSATYSCTNGGANCSYSDNFSENGVNYQTTNVTVSGNNTVGYNISATVFIGELGFVEITGTGLTICANGNIGSGTIQVVDENNAVVLTIDFPDCDTMVVTFMGVSETVPQ